MSTKNITECIPRDQLYAYLAGELFPEQEVVVESHLAHCDHCLAQLNRDELIMSPVETAAEQAILDDIYQETFTKGMALWPGAVSTSNVGDKADLLTPRISEKPPFNETNASATILAFPTTSSSATALTVAPAGFRQRWRWVAAVAAVLVVCFTAAIFWNRNSTLNSATDPVAQAQLVLQQSSALERPTEFRLAAASYAPYRKERGDRLAETSLTQLKSVQATLQAAVEDEPQPITQQLLAQVAVTTGDVDVAIEQLLKVNLPNASIYNDLAIAYIEKGQTTLALQYLTQALIQDPRHLEALFNRALLHQQLRRPLEAKQDWQAYLALESTATWAAEARTYLEQLEK
jgi:tetratricopeptide (TPR) repeat protein